MRPQVLQSIVVPTFIPSPTKFFSRSTMGCTLSSATWGGIERKLRKQCQDFEENAASKAIFTPHWTGSQLQA